VPSPISLLMSRELVVPEAPANSRSVRCWCKQLSRSVVPDSMFSYWRVSTTAAQGAQIRWHRPQQLCRPALDRPPRLWPREGRHGHQCFPSHTYVKFLAGIAHDHNSTRVIVLRTTGTTHHLLYWSALARVSVTNLDINIGIIAKGAATLPHACALDDDQVGGKVDSDCQGLEC